MRGYHIPVDVVNSAVREYQRATPAQTAHAIALALVHTRLQLHQAEATLDRIREALGIET